MDKGDLIHRVERYRSAGSGADGLHVLRMHQIDEIDYGLMGADNSCAEFHHPEVGCDGIRRQLWFCIKLGSELSRRGFYNSHGISHDGGKTFETESALMDIPRPEYEVEPAEVVWQWSRVNELKQHGIERPERIAIMTEERKARPWQSWITEGPPDSSWVRRTWGVITKWID